MIINKRNREKQEAINKGESIFVDNAKMDTYLTLHCTHISKQNIMGSILRELFEEKIIIIRSVVDQKQYNFINVASKATNFTL